MALRPLSGHGHHGWYRGLCMAWASRLALRPLSGHGRHGWYRGLCMARASRLALRPLSGHGRHGWYRGLCMALASRLVSRPLHGTGITAGIETSGWLRMPGRNECRWSHDCPCLPPRLSAMLHTWSDMKGLRPLMLEVTEVCR